MGHDMLVLGLDAGGTSTRAVVTTGQGECVGYGVGGRGNPISAGPARAAAGVLEAVERALVPSGSTLADVAVITAAMAGQRTIGGEEAWLRDPLAARGFTGRLTFEPDLLAAYFSATAAESGYAVVSGTGACAIRVAHGEIRATADGLGWLLGDRGSGFWIGHRVARAVVRDLDHAGPATALTPALLEHLGLTSAAAQAAEDATDTEGRSRALTEVVGALYALRPIELASFAPLAFATDDPVAERILRRAGEHLAATLTAVLAGPGPLAIGGGVLSRPSAVRDAFVQRLGEAATGLEVLPVGDGAVGAGLLALRAGGAPASAATLRSLTETIACFR